MATNILANQLGQSHANISHTQDNNNLLHASSVQTPILSALHGLFSPHQTLCPFYR